MAASVAVRSAAPPIVGVSVGEGNAPFIVHVVDAVTPAQVQVAPAFYIVIGEGADLGDLGSAALADVEDFATAAQGLTADSAVQPGDLAPVATSGDYGDLTGTPSLGTAAAADATDFATAAQGATADTAVQPGDLSAVATSGDYSDLSGTPSLGTASSADSTDFATAAQGAVADTAVQPGDLAAVATSGAYGDLSGTPTLGTAAAANTGDFDAAGTAATAVAALSTVYQPLSAQLSALALLAGTSFGRDFVTLADHAALISKLALVASDIPDLPASKITSGLIDTARLGTGTANSTKVLLGDQTWGAVPGSTVDVVSNVATSTMLGRTTAGSGDSEELTPTQARTVMRVSGNLQRHIPDANYSGVRTGFGSTMFRPGTVSSVAAIAAGQMFINKGCLDHGTLTKLVIFVTATSLTAGQFVTIVCYNLDETARALPTTLAWSENVTVGASIGTYDITTSVARDIPDGGYAIGILNPSGNAGSCTFSAWNGLDGFFISGHSLGLRTTLNVSGLASPPDLSSYAAAGSSGSTPPVLQTQTTTCPAVLCR